MQLDDSHYEAFMEQGYVMVEGFYPEEMRARIAALLRRIMPPWRRFERTRPRGACSGTTSPTRSSTSTTSSSTPTWSPS